MQSGDARFPSAWQAALLLLANFLLQYLLGALFYDVRRTTDLTTGQNQALVMVLAYGLLLIVVMHHRRMTYRDLFHSTRSSAAVTSMLLVPPVLLLVPLVLLLDQVLMFLLHQLLPLSRWEEQAFAGMTANNLPALLATCVLAPLFEEMLFRGILLRAFLTRHSRWAAIAYSALFFGAAHLNVYQFVLAFWLGLVLGWLFERSRSLIPCIALHAAFNASVMALAWTKEPMSEPPTLEAGAGAWVLALVAAAIGTLVLRRVLAAPRRELSDGR